MSAKSQRRLMELGSLHWAPGPSAGHSAATSEVGDRGGDPEAAHVSAEAAIAGEASLRYRYAAVAAVGQGDDSGRPPAVPEDGPRTWEGLQPLGSRSRSVAFARHVRSASGSTYPLQ